MHASHLSLDPPASSVNLLEPFCKVLASYWFTAAQAVSLFGALLYADVKLVISWVVLCPPLLQTALQLHQVALPTFNSIPSLSGYL